MRLRSHTIRHVVTYTTKRVMIGEMPPYLKVVGRGCQFGYFSQVSFQHHLRSQRDLSPPSHVVT